MKEIGTRRRTNRSNPAGVDELANNGLRIGQRNAQQRAGQRLNG
jgi:hypothetical protein